MASLKSPTKLHLPKQGADHDANLNLMKLYRKVDDAPGAVTDKELTRRQQRAVRQPAERVSDSVPVRALRRGRSKKAAASTAAMAWVSFHRDARAWRRALR